MKYLQIVLLFLLLIGCYGIESDKKFDLQLDINQNFKHGYNICNVTQETVNGSTISSDSSFSSTNINVIKRTNDYYTIEHKEESKKYTELFDLSDLRLIVSFDYYGKYLGVENEIELTDYMYDAITSNAKKTYSVVTNPEFKKQMIDKFDAEYRTIFTKERLLSIVQAMINMSDITDCIGCTIGDTLNIDSELSLPMLGKVKSCRKIFIEELSKINNYRVVLIDTLDSVDYNNKLINLANISEKDNFTYNKNVRKYYYSEAYITINAKNGLCEHSKIKITKRSEANGYIEEIVEITTSNLRNDL